MDDWLKDQVDQIRDEDIELSLEQLYLQAQADIVSYKDLSDTRYRIIMALTDIIHQIMCDTENGRICMSEDLQRKIRQAVMQNDPFALDRTGSKA